MITAESLAAGARTALCGPVRRRSLRAAAVVGTVLTALNHGDLLLRGEFPPALWWKIPLTYVVPFLVATYGALGARAPVEPSRRGSRGLPEVR